MASILFVLSKNTLGRFCGVYTGHVPQVSYRMLGFPLRKLRANNNSSRLTYWITETDQEIVDLHLLIKLTSVYAEFSDNPDATEGTLDKVVLIGFPFCDYQMPDWLTQPTGPGSLQTSTGLKLLTLDRRSISVLFEAIKRTNDNCMSMSPGIPIIQETDFDTLTLTRGNIGVPPFHGVGWPGATGRNVNVNRSHLHSIVDLTRSNANNNNNNNNNEMLNTFAIEFGIPDIEHLADARTISSVKQELKNVNPKEASDKKRRKLLSRLRLDEDKSDEEVKFEKEESRCCVCFEDFYEPIVKSEENESEENENNKRDEKYGDGIFVVPVALVPCQHRLCVNCVQQLRDSAKTQCPVCKAAIEAWETYNCVTCLKKQEIQKGPNIVVARPCEHRVWCKDCAKDAIKDENPVCPLCNFPVDDLRVAKEYK